MVNWETGHHPRFYCSDACRQKDYRGRKEQQEKTQAALREAALSARIGELEDRVQLLQARLNLEERLHADVAVRRFKTWLVRHPQPQDTDFFKRFLADQRLPQHASRALYEAKLRVLGYQAEDIHLFRDAWLTMLLNQS